MARPAKSPTFNRSRNSEWGLTWVCRTNARSRAQRPWHFLYFAPEPHQHGSLRPIRAPLGVNPGFGPPAAGPPPLEIGWSPSDSTIGRAVVDAGPPRRTAEPPTAAPATAVAGPEPVAPPPAAAPAG